MSSATATLRPASGRRIRKPDGTLLAEAGERVVLDTYWFRRLADNDVLHTARTAKPKRISA